MPAKTKKQRKAMAIAEHHPGKLYKRNRGLLKMSKGQLSDFARTKEKSLPESFKDYLRKSGSKKKGKKRSKKKSKK